MTPNCAAASQTSREPNRPRIETRTRRGVSPPQQRGDGGQAIRPRARNRPGRQPPCEAARDLHPPLLSAPEERKLAERIKAGDQLAQQQLVLANRKLVFRIVRNYKITGISQDDLIQEGSVGLIRAAQNFDPSTHGIRFSYYAAFWIRAFIQRAISNNSSLVRLPEYTRLLRGRYRRASCELEKQNDAGTKSVGEEAPRRAEIARSLGISLRQLKRAWLLLAERALRTDQGEPATDSPTAEDELLKHEERAVVHAALRRLSPFEAWVICERFGLGECSSNPIAASYPRRKAASRLRADQARRGQISPSAQPARASRTYYGRSYEELSGECGLSVHRVRWVERIALDKLRSVLSPAVAHDR
jgi:RNA polymerase sigma factor (sigma-70 family)